MEAEAICIAALPDDALAGVLRVLPPRSLAVARCVCKAWRDIVDAHALLRRHLLPHSVHGIFINYVDHYRTHLFSRPSSSSTFPGIDGLLSFLPNDGEEDPWTIVLDHCNGLLLIEWKCELCVCNPATRWWTLLPEPRFGNNYIAFDPTVSPHYEVFLIPDVPEKPKPAAPVRRNTAQDIDAPTEDQITVEEDQQHVEEEPPPTMDDKANWPDNDDDPCRLMEWPPSPWSFKVFSSRTGQWEDRSFVREGQPAGTVEAMRLDDKTSTGSWWYGLRQRYAVYHNGGLYVHCRGEFMARFSLSKSKYQVLKMPTETKDVKPYLGRSKNEVYFGIVGSDDRKLRVWTLNESGRHMEWILKYEVYIGHYAKHVASMPDGSWMVQEDNYISYNDTDVETESNDESIQWDSDNDDIFTVEARGEEGRWDTFSILGFHPFKEVVYLQGAQWFKVACYHLDSSKIQYLGKSRPNCYYQNYINDTCESFVYTPCLVGELDEDDAGTSIDDEINRARG